jgi:transcriptional regulator with PAS, ATPase and Fis domain
MPDSPSPNRKGRPKGAAALAWWAFFQRSRTPVFVLGKGRRLRFANPAWERLAGVKLADARGMVCSAHRHGTPLAAALAPTPEALAGRPDSARRPAPPGRTGPPWWDVTFAPLAGDDGLLGLIGFIAVVGERVPAAERKVPAGVMATRDRHARHFTLDLLAGTSPAAGRFVSQVRLASQTTAPVWLVGEPGSGKETAARVIHHAGTRRERMFVGLDCSALQPYLIDGLLAGHGGLVGSDRVGTVYLKDPAALPRDFQQRLVELFAEGKPATPRLVCGSTRPAADDRDHRGLLPDFHADLSVLEIRVPPLRERVEDLPRVVLRMLEWVTHPKAALAGIDPSFFRVASAYAWPGNLRELRDVLTAVVAAAGTGRVTAEHLPWDVRARAGVAGAPPGGPSLQLDPILEAVEKRLIRLAFRKTHNHQTEAAELLGIFRARLWRRLEALGIPVPPQPPKPRKKDADPS